MLFSTSSMAPSTASAFPVREEMNRMPRAAGPKWYTARKSAREHKELMFTVETI